MADLFDLVSKMADGRFHSGRELGEILGISRAAVWKKLQNVKSCYGLEIDSVKGKGYRFRDPLDLLKRTEILDELKLCGLDEMPSMEIYPTIDSTNRWLMQKGALGIKSGSVCLAEQQLSGKGRHGRQWVSPFGRNLYFSMLLRFDLAPMQVAGLSLAAAIGVLRMLHEINCCDVGLKWPNDIFWNDKKLAGLLLEVSGEAGGPSQVVIGVGLNIGMGEQGRAIDQPWSDLSEIPEVVPYSRSMIAARLIFHLKNVAEHYRLEGLRGFVDEWHQHDLYLGEDVVISSVNNSQVGEHLGISETGGICIRVDGETRTFHAGEVSLRKAR
jgi:BirA family transcriptional regulator, biotin operon repressor / biotin---[acetyl-CoA-carboxylase] ligase